MRVIPADIGDVEDLVHCTRAGLAVLPLDDITQCRLFLEHEIVEPIDDRDAFGQRGCSPCRLRGPGLAECPIDIGFTAVGNLHHRLQVEWRKLRGSDGIVTRNDVADHPLDFSPIEVRPGTRFAHGRSVRVVRCDRR